MATWPSTLPDPLVDGYGIEPVSQTVSTDMEVGSARVRRRSFAQVDMLPVQWSLSNDQMTVFRAWFSHPIGADGGAAWFSTSLLMGDGSARTVQARFAGNWKAVYVPHLRWQVRAMLEVRYSTVLTALEQQNILRGIMEKDVVLLWTPTTQADVLASKVGPDAAFSVTGAQYDENGTSLGTVAALHSKGVWVGPAYSNLFTGAVAEQTKTLTAQKYTVWCAAGSVVCGAYGTATAAAPLTFTATAGNCTFTPSGVTRWMLTASVAPMPYIAPGVSVASAAGSTTNGLAWAMSAEMTAALSGACTVAAVVTMGVGSGDLPSGLAVSHVGCRDTTYNDVLFSYDNGAGAQRLVRSSDAVNQATYVGDGWSRNERHIKIVQTNAAASQFRVGNQRVGIDSAIQWGSWETYDGSFNPLTYLRAAYGNTVPLWISKVMVSKLGGLTDAQIEERLNA